MWTLNRIYWTALSSSLLALMLAAAPLGARADEAPADTLAPAPKAQDSAPGDTLNPFRIEMIPVDENADVEDDHSWDDDPFDRDHRWDDDWFDEDWFGDDLTKFRFRYNRVEGIMASLRFGRDLSGRGFQPRWEAEWGYAFSNKRGVYRLGIQQPLISNQDLVLGAAAFRENSPGFGGFDVISGGENTASFLVLSKDYVDWYEQEGGEAWLGYSPVRDLDLRAGIGVADHAALKVNQTGLWNKDHIRPNPEARGGSYRAFEAAATYDTRDQTKRRWKRRSRQGIEHFQRLRYEHTGMQSDFDLWRLYWDGRSYFYLTPRQEMTVRVFAGTGEDKAGNLPAQKRFVIGGLGTLRGHNFKDVQGDHAFLANFEYAFSLGGSTRGLLFVDTGSAWDGEFGDVSQQRVGVDLGTGVRLGHDGIRFLAAKQVNKSDTPVKFVVRFQRPI